MKALVRDRKGVTLIELLVAMAIMGIVMAGIIGVFVLGNNLYKSAGREFDEHSAALQLEQNIEKSIQYSAAVSIYSGQSDLSSVSQPNAIYFDQTVLTPDIRALVVKTGSNSSRFMQGAFQGYDCDVNFTKVNSTTLQVSVTIQKGTDSYTLTKNILLENLSVSGTAIGGAATGRLIGFTPYTQPTGSSI